MATLQVVPEVNTPGVLSRRGERRAYPRSHWQGTAVIRILPSRREVLGVLQDFSDGGCGIELGMDLPAQVGATVEVDLNMQGSVLRRRGVVRRIDVIRRVERETVAGIEFNDGGRGRLQ